MSPVLPTAVGRSFHRRRVAIAVLALAVALGCATTVASAGTTTYYGYNYLAPSIPEECLSAWGAGCAQSGWNYWDWSEITKNSGDYIALGFRDPDGWFYYQIFGSDWNGTTFHVTRTGVYAPPYNRAFCAYYSGNSSYVQCRAVIF